MLFSFYRELDYVCLFIRPLRGQSNYVWNLENQKRDNYFRIHVYYFKMPDVSVLRSWKDWVKANL